MTIKTLKKMFASGDSDQLRKACDELTDTLTKLERDVAMLKAQGPIIVPQSTYRAVEKSHDNPLVHDDRHGSLNGHPVNLDQLTRDARKFAEGPDRI